VTRPHPGCLHEAAVDADRAYARAGDGVLLGSSVVLRFKKHQAFVGAALKLS
jgi:hypothetical protein